MSNKATHYVQYCLFYFAISGLGGIAAAGDDPKKDDAWLSAQWWQNAASISVADNPVNDDNGARCITGQRGAVWFLYGSFGNEPGFPTVRYCTVPAGVKLFFPIVNLVCIPFPGETIQQNRGFCADFIDLVDSMSLEVDGKDRSKRIQRLVQSRPFPVSLPEDNIFDFEGFDAPAGTYRGVADGYYADLRLPQGEHMIRIQGGVSIYGFALDVIYVLQVVKPEKVITPR